MGETLNLLFRSRDDSTYELQVKESWSGRVVTGSFLPPYVGKAINALQKKLNNLDSSDAELRTIGYKLFSALCGSDDKDLSVQAVLRSVIQRTLKRRGTVALTLIFGSGCEEFIRYPWELLHNGDHFLLVSGIFTLSRALLRPEVPVGYDLPVHPPFRMLYVAASPTDCAPLETERSFEAMEQALTPLIESGQVFLDRLEPPTFSQLVRYFNSVGGAGTFDDNDTQFPCYVLHFDGHGAYGCLCPDEDCETVNGPDMRRCQKCGTALGRIKPQTYLCFCNEDGSNQFIDTQALRDLFVSSDLRLAVFSACETATVTSSKSAHVPQSHAAVDATLATALVTAQVPAVVAMPFSLQDDLSPKFMYHFYEALADGRTLEEALSRARQALLAMQQKSWFIPVLYRHIAEDDEGPVALLAIGDAADEHAHPLAHLGPPTAFVGREQELHAIDELLYAFTSGGQKQKNSGRTSLSRTQPVHHIALVGSPGIGKSALALEIAYRHREKFSGGVIGVSLQDGKLFADALLEMIQQLHIPVRNSVGSDVKQRERLVQGTLRSLANRGLPSLVMLDSFEEVKDRLEVENWLHFLCALPQEVVILVTSRSNPSSMIFAEGSQCRWYEYRVGKMTEADLLALFIELATASGLDQRIRLSDPRQQRVLREICTLLDGYPLGAELIFGTTRIGGKVYTPEAATRSLEEVRDELRETPLAGILAVLEVSFRRLNPPARLLLSYLAAFKLPFNGEQIKMLVTQGLLTAANEATLQPSEQQMSLTKNAGGPTASSSDRAISAMLAENWRPIRDELVQASLIQFDVHVYNIHPQICHFALSYLSIDERRRVHRVVAAYYINLPHPKPEEWFAAFEHLEAAGDEQDIQEAVRLALRAAWALAGQGHIPEVQKMLNRAAIHASRLSDTTGEGQIQCCLGAILRQLGQYVEAEACFKSSLALHREQPASEHTTEQIGWALYELALLANEEGNFQQASGYVQDAWTHFHQINHEKGKAWTQWGQGRISLSRACYEDALKHFETASGCFVSLRNSEGQAITLRDRGSVYANLGQYQKAQKAFDSALNLFNANNLSLGEAWTLSYMSMLYVQVDKLQQAEKACNEALKIFREQGIRRGEAWVLRAMGDVLSKQHNFSGARRYYEEAQALFGAVGDRIDLAFVLNSLGALALEEHEYLDAKDLYEQTRSIALEYGVKQLVGRALYGLGDLACALEQLTDAERYYQSACEIARTLQNPVEISVILQRLALFYERQQKYSDALDYWVQALSLGLPGVSLSQPDLHEKVQRLVEEQHLEEAYNASRERWNAR